MQRSRRLLYLVLFVLVLGHATLAGAQLQLGNLALFHLDEEEEELRDATSLQQAVQSPGYLSRIGRVTFAQKAQPAPGTVVNSLSLEYVPEGADGQRLRLTLNGETVQTTLPDWQLIPIARVADTGWFALVTLYGSLRAPAVDALAKLLGMPVVNYHPALRNTLLGLRLFQLDILILFKDAVDLPSQGSGETRKIILGHGESPPDVAKGQVAFDALQAYITQVRTGRLDATEKRGGMRYRSYLICDCDQTVTFHVQGGMLHYSGHPVFYFWRHKGDNPTYSAAKRRAELDSTVRQQVIQARQGQGTDLEAKAWYVGELQRLLKSDALRDLGSARGGDVASLVALEPGMALDQVEQALGTLDEAGLHRRLVWLQEYMEANSVEYLREISEAVSNRQEQLRTINPAVWDAATNTMRFAAFFRYCKEHFAQQWSKFMAQITHVVPAPQVQTPTSIR